MLETIKTLLGNAGSANLRNANLLIGTSEAANQEIGAPRRGPLA